MHVLNLFGGEGANRVPTTLPPNIFRNYRNKLSLLLSYFPIAAFCHLPLPPPPATSIKFLILWVNKSSSQMILSARSFYCWKGRRSRQFSIYYTRITILWPIFISVAAVAFTVPIIYVTRSHYPERASALDLKEPATPRFGHSNVVCDLFIETRFSHLIACNTNIHLIGVKNIDTSSGDDSNDMKCLIITKFEHIQGV